MDLLLLQDFQFKEKLTSVLDDKDFVKMLEANHIFELMRLIKTSYPTQETLFRIWYDRYVELFEFLFKEDVFHKIKTSDEFEFYRDLILISNGMEVEKPNPNPEIQRPKDAWNMIQRMKGGIPSFEDKVSSVALFYGGDISELTLYQLDSFFMRAIKYSMWIPTLIGKMFSSETEVDSWYINKETVKEELTISEEEVKGFTIQELTDTHFTNNKE